MQATSRLDANHIRWDSRFFERAVYLRAPESFEKRRSRDWRKMDASKKEEGWG